MKQSPAGAAGQQQLSTASTLMPPPVRDESARAILSSRHTVASPVPGWDQHVLSARRHRARGSRRCCRRMCGRSASRRLLRGTSSLTFPSSATRGTGSRPLPVVGYLVVLHALGAFRVLSL